MSMILPELLLLGLALGILIGDLFIAERQRRYLSRVAVAGLLMVLVAIVYQLDHMPLVRLAPAWLGSMVACDGLAVCIKLLACLCGLMVFLTIGPYSRRRLQEGQGEFCALNLCVLLATMLMGSARNLLAIYLAVEFTSLTSYLLAAFLKRETKAAEAGLKYFLIGSVSSGIMLYGMSLMYGLSAAYYNAHPGPRGDGFSVLGLNELGVAIAGSGGAAEQTLATVAFIFILAGVGFKMAIAPFHMWCPDVYEGAPTPFSALLSVAPKAAGFVLLMRFLDTAFPQLAAQWSLLIAVLAALTMTVGNLEAIAQSNLKRMLAYSSVAHAGYLLMALAVPREALGGDAWMRDASILLHLFAYVFMNIGAFAVVIFMSEVLDTEQVEHTRFLAQGAPAVAGLFVVFGLSLAGLPPSLGFVSKYLLLCTAMKGGLNWLAVVAVLNSLISIYYYFNIVRQMFFSAPLMALPGAGAALVDAAGVVVPERALQPPLSLSLALAIAGVGTLLIGVLPQPLLDFARSVLGS